MNNFLSPVKVTDSFSYPSKVLLAPMEGVMNKLSCAAWSLLNLNDCWITPFFRVSQHPQKVRYLLEFLQPYLEARKPIIVQLMGYEPEVLAQTARDFWNLNSQCDNLIVGFNLNFACPSRKVILHGAGGGLLNKVSLLREIVLKVRDFVPDAVVEAKIRTGYASSDEMEVIIPTLVESGVNLLHVHYRTVLEGYQVSLAAAERMKRAVELANGVAVFGSGDIYSTTDAKRFINDYGCAGVLAARGFLKDPYLIRKIQGKVVTDFDGRYEVVKALFDVSFEKKVNKGQFIEQLAWMYGPNDPLFRRFLTLPLDGVDTLLQLDKLKEKLLIE